MNGHGRYYNTGAEQFDWSWRKGITANSPQNRNRKKTTCGLFALGEGTFESLTRFKRITDFLFSIYDVRDIYVDSSYSLSSFLFALVYATASRIALRETKITALMCADTFSADDDDQNDMRKSLCPPCHSVTYVSRVGTGDDNSDFDVISDMIERADFCICDLSSAQYSEKYGSLLPKQEDQSCWI